jgi:hypothetical protein
MARSKVLWGVGGIMLSMAMVTLAKDTVDVSVSGDFFSKYIWRGQNIVDDWVFQPGASVGFKGFTASIWNNMNMKDAVVSNVLVESGSLTETDLAIDYSNKVPGLDVLGFSVGAIYYDFLNTHTHPTAEAYGGFNLDVPSAPAIRWYYDFEEADGSYAQFSVGHTIQKLHEWSKDCSCGLQTGASLGMGTRNYNRFYFGVDQTALNDFTLTAGLPLNLGKVTIKPSLGYSMMLSKDIRTATVRSDNFWGGVGLVHKF